MRTSLARTIVPAAWLLVVGGLVACESSTQGPATTSNAEDQGLPPCTAPIGAPCNEPGGLCLDTVSPECGVQSCSEGQWTCAIQPTGPTGSGVEKEATIAECPTVAPELVYTSPTRIAHLRVGESVLVLGTETDTATGKTLVTTSAPKPGGTSSFDDRVSWSFTNSGDLGFFVRRDEVWVVERKIVGSTSTFRVARETTTLAESPAMPGSDFAPLGVDDEFAYFGRPPRFLPLADAPASRVEPLYRVKLEAGGTWERLSDWPQSNQGSQFGFGILSQAQAGPSGWTLRAARALPDLGDPKNIQREAGAFWSYKKWLPAEGGLLFLDIRSSIVGGPSSSIQKLDLTGAPLSPAVVSRTAKWFASSDKNRVLALEEKNEGVAGWSVLETDEPSNILVLDVSSGTGKRAACDQQTGEGVISDDETHVYWVDSLATRTKVYRAPK